MLWYRAAELKHSRVAMLACTGWLVNQYELYFPGNLAAGKAFSSLGKNPLEAWAATPYDCLLYTSPSPRDATLSRMPSSA